MLFRFQYSLLCNPKHPAGSSWLPLATSILKAAKPYCSQAKNLKPSDKMTQTLKMKFPLAKSIKVVDVSGGCGSMYEIYVESVEFKGLSLVKQHKLINEILKDDIKLMHGLRIQTKIPQ